MVSLLFQSLNLGEGIFVALSFLSAVAVKNLGAVPHSTKECIGEFVSNS